MNEIQVMLTTVQNKVLKYTVLSLVMLSVIKTTYSQGLEMGVGIGLNRGMLKYASSSTEKLSSPIIAFHVESLLSPHWSLDAAFGFTGKGGGDFEEEDKLHWGDGKAKASLGYVTSTVRLRYYLLESSGFKPFLSVGPGIGYLVSFKGFGTDEREHLRSKFDMGLLLGFGVKTSIKKHLFLEVLAGIDRGLGKIMRNRNESLFNHGIQFTIGIKKGL